MPLSQAPRPRALPRPSGPDLGRAKGSSSTRPAKSSDTVRLQSEEVHHPPLEIPPPETFGLGRAASREDVDWVVVSKRLHNLRVTKFHSQRVPGGYRFTCVLPGNPGVRIEADGLTEAEAIDLALSRAEKRLSQLATK